MPLHIDGRAAEVSEGRTILEAAQGIGVEIPTLCWAKGLSPEGGCRLCLVEVEGERLPVASCHQPVRAGMVVRTATAALHRMRTRILELIVSEHPSDAFAAGTRLAALLGRHGVSSGGGRGERDVVDRSHPYMRFDRSRCIQCRLCLRACEEIQGQFVFGVEGRGGESRLVHGATDRFAESGCVACGACVDVCPAGAVSDRDRIDATPPSASVRSVCGFCGVGCRIEVATDGHHVTRIDGVPDAAVNQGHLCVKGRYAHAYQRSPERLTRPLLRVGGRLQPVSWDEALSFAADRLRAIHRRGGGAALGVMTSSRSTNEAAYLLQKVFRVLLRSNNVDCCARVCHSSTALALRMTIGTGAASASFADIESARCIVIAGANPTEAHPVVGARLKQAALRGMPIVAIDPRRTELAALSRIHLALRPGTNVALFNAIAKVLIDERLVDRPYIDARCEGFAELEAHLRSSTLEALVGACGVDVAEAVGAARLIGGAGPTLFVSGLGLSEQSQGTASVMTLCNLGLLTGSIGRPGAGMLPLRGQNNVQGNADMGAMPDQVAGYQPLDDPQVAARLVREWSAAPPPEPGLTIREMMDAAADGRLRGLWIQGEDPVQSDPDEARTIAALTNLDLLVVQELFLSRTAELAHLVLPAAGALEQDGTFTNAERRIQRVRAAVAPPGEAKPDWLVATMLARRLGASWRHDGPADIMGEIARVAPSLFGGVRFDRLDGDGLQWPCPGPDHPGTTTMHANGFARGRARLISVDFEPPPEQADAERPYVLITGRVLDHYNVGSMTRRTPSAELASEDRLEIHPEDAARERIVDRQRVRIASRWGQTEAQARLSRRVAPGTLFVSFHFPQTRTNCLVGPHVDPLSKCPDYKVTAVSVKPATPAADPA
ncbi:MAG: formate dehydrogenase subunit alpha [Phycisphaerales bacterium]